jgi:hypothetical protein
MESVDDGIRKRGMDVSEHTRRLYLFIDAGKTKAGLRVSRSETRTVTQKTGHDFGNLDRITTREGGTYSLMRPDHG